MRQRRLKLIGGRIQLELDTSPFAPGAFGGITLS